ncbi:MAG TPA: hypothetical protein VHD36_03775 [Pirellulales bacterium]|nr:hypothetical protein [Pirellulales bacterium]
MAACSDSSTINKRACGEVPLKESCDIYAELLGLPAGPRPPDYYALLGLRRNEGDIARIHRAARRQIARLSNLLGSDQAEAAQQLMADIATARAVLTTPAARERYDARLREQPDFVPQEATIASSNADGLLPPSVTDRAVVQTPVGAAPDISAPSESVLGRNEADASAMPRWANPVEAPPLPPDSPVAAPTAAKARLIAGPGAAFQAAQPVHLDEVPSLPPAAHEPLPEAWHPSVDSNMPGSFTKPGVRRAAPITRRNSRARERSQMAMILVLLCVFGACGLAGGMVLVWRERQRSVAAAESMPAALDEKSAKPSAPAAPKSSKPRVQGRPTNDPTGILSDRKLVPTGKRSATEREGTLGEESSQTTLRDAEKSMPEIPAMPKREPAMPAGAVEMPARPAADESAQAAKVRQTLEKARNALARGELENVDQLLNLAMADAATDRLRGDVEGVRTLRSCVGSFNNAVRESLKTVTSNTELEYGGDVVIVVEVSRDRDRLVARIKGQNRDFRVEQLPADLAAALAERWLAKDDVNSRAFIGAYLTTTARNEYVERGRAMLREAQAAGSDVAKAALEALAR